MAIDYQINLSSGELYTLAGLLHYKCLYGIENQTAIKWQSDLDRYIRQTVKRLENKKLILFELHGKLLIDPHIRMIVETISRPDRIAVISGSVRNRKTATMYVLEKDGVAITVSQLDEENYKIVMYTAQNAVALLHNHFSGFVSSSFQERILLEDVKYIQDKIASFQQDAAKAHLCKCVKDQGSIDFCYDILAKENDYTEIRLLQRKNDFYETKNSFVTSFNQNNSAFVNINENGVLTIDSFDEKVVAEIIDSFFAPTRKGESDNG